MPFLVVFTSILFTLSLLFRGLWRGGKVALAAGLVCAAVYLALGINSYAIKARRTEVAYLEKWYPNGPTKIVLQSMSRKKNLSAEMIAFILERGEAKHVLTLLEHCENLEELEDLEQKVQGAAARLHEQGDDQLMQVLKEKTEALRRAPAEDAGSMPTTQSASPAQTHGPR